jgi:hypothetical protein
VAACGTLVKRVSACAFLECVWRGAGGEVGVKCACKECVLEELTERLDGRFATSMPAHQSVPAHVPVAHHRAHPAQLMPHIQRNAVRGRRDTALIVPGGGAMSYVRYAPNEGAPMFARGDYPPNLHHGLGDTFLGNGGPGLLQHLPPQVCPPPPPSPPPPFFFTVGPMLRLWGGKGQRSRVRRLS